MISASRSRPRGYLHAAARAWIGCSGWSYDHWVGVLYPEGLPKARWRDAYAETFDCVELNASYHRWPGTKRFEQWSEVLPDEWLDTDRDVWAFIDNDGAGHAVRNAQRLRDQLGGDA